MKYETINAKRMNEYLGYMKGCLDIYLLGKDISKKEHDEFTSMVESLQGLNNRMEDIQADMQVEHLWQNPHEIEDDSE